MVHGGGGGGGGGGTRDVEEFSMKDERYENRSQPLYSNYSIPCYTRWGGREKNKVYRLLLFFLTGLGVLL